MPTRLSIAAACVVLALAFGVTRSGLSAVAAAQRGAAGQETTQPQPPNMQAMMKMHEQMMAEMKAGDAKLDALANDMNVATSEARVTAMAAVVNELVRQHKAMHGHMEHMHHEMMAGRGSMMRR